jgi:hypothetical protein
MRSPWALIGWVGRACIWVMVIYSADWLAAADRRLPLHADPRPRSGGLLQGLPPQQLVRRGGLCMKYHDLRDFIAQLESIGELKRIGSKSTPAGDDRNLRPRAARRRPGHPVREARKGTPCRCWPICSARRAAWRWAWGRRSVEALREVGKLLAYLKEPEPPKGLKDAWDKLPVLKQVLNMSPKSRLVGAVPGNRLGRQGRRSVAPADPALLAGRRGAADHLGADGDARAAQAAAEPRHLPPAGDRAATR